MYNVRRIAHQAKSLEKIKDFKTGCVCKREEEEGTGVVVMILYDVAIKLLNLPSGVLNFYIISSASFRTYIKRVSIFECGLHFWK